MTRKQRGRCLIRLRCRLVAALQDRVVQIGRVRFARIESDDNSPVLRIDLYIAHAFDFQQRLAQFLHAFLIVIAFGRDLDRFQNRMIGAFGIKRVGRIGLVWLGWVHHLSNAAGRRAGCLGK